METTDRPMPDWLKGDIDANERMKGLKAATTEGTWYAEQAQDGEYTGPGDDPPGYAGEWYETGSILADPGCDDPDDDHRPVGVFSTAYPRHEMGNTAWAIAAHTDDAEGRYERLMAAYRLRAEAVRLALRFLPIFPEHTTDSQWADAQAIRAAEMDSRGETQERIGWALDALDTEREVREQRRVLLGGGA